VYGGRQTPDLLLETEMESLIINTDDYNGSSKIVKSFLLMDSNENLCIPSPELFCKKLQCNDENRLKVVSIFGNTGDGKSHTLNQFFNGEDVFQTSCEQVTINFLVLDLMIE
jgi:zinc finger FYVE domain-containing protein 1